MTGLLANIREIRSTIDEIEGVYKSLEGRKPDMFQVALPVLYRQARERQWLEDKMLDLIRTYLKAEYPELSDYLLSRESRKERDSKSALVESRIE